MNKRIIFGDLRFVYSESDFASTPTTRHTERKIRPVVANALPTIALGLPEPDVIVLDGLQSHPKKMERERGVPAQTGAGDISHDDPALPAIAPTPQVPAAPN